MRLSQLNLANMLKIQVRHRLSQAEDEARKRKAEEQEAKRRAREEEVERRREAEEQERKVRDRHPRVLHMHH